MRPQNSPLTKSSNVYKSSTMLRKVSPQQTIMTSNMIESKKHLTSVRSQQLLRSTSGRENQVIKQSNDTNKQNDNMTTLRSMSNTIGQRQMPNPFSKTEEKLYTFSNDDEYIGEWSYDERQLRQKPHGYGCYKFKKQGVQYRGYFKQGLMHGTGTLHRLVKRGKPETIYQGEWMNGEKNGTGKYFYDDGIYYEGNWNRNRKEGKGKFYSPQGQYDGLWVNDRKHGRGYLKLPNGTIYDGQWQNDQFLNGQIRYSNNDIYKGQVNDRFERNAQGEYVLGSKQQIYKGAWRNNKKQGQGEIVYNPSGEKFTGQLRNDNREGQNCIYEWKNGHKTICTFQNNFPVRGKMINPDNTSFEFDMHQSKPRK